MPVTVTSPSLLATDGYKFSMAEAGWPLRQETFYYAHRRGGVQVVPFDLEAVIRSLLPTAEASDYAFLDAHSYEMGAGFKAALQRTERLVIRAMPRGALVFPGEPLFTVTGPSALVSWLEPQVLQLNYRFQLATLALTDREALAQAVVRVTCEAQKQVVIETLDAVGMRPPPITLDPDGYVARVRAAVKELVEVVEDPSRLFEVGMRSATCMDQHELALGVCKELGVTRTSNVYLAKKLGLVPIGTMGHEHVQRYGSDEVAFRAMRERRPHRSSYLLDTFDTLSSGLPAAFKLLGEEPNRGDSIRYDSGDKKAQYLYAIARAKELGVRPVQILEDALDAQATREFEALRKLVEWGPHEQFYGYGGAIVGKTLEGGLTRDRVAAIYKLSCTGNQPTMKFGNELQRGKQSLPGVPVVFRRRTGSGPLGIIGQHDERPPEGYFLLTGSAAESPSMVANRGVQTPAEGPELSPATRALVEALRSKRARYTAL